MSGYSFINYSAVFFSNSITILQLCSTIGNQLPRFCYHHALPIAANCRMCLVQLEESNKPVAACAVAAVNGMRVFTETSLVKQARENVLEFLLINHPLDCPICDQGGECDLQDQTMVFGSDRGRYYEKKRAVKDFNLGIVVKTFMTRCIHCTRCVRFSQNLLGSNELGILGRGSNMRISTFLKKPLLSVLSGNIADICPVGALTSKPYAFTARPWELTAHLAIDFFDAFGGNLRVDTRGVEIMRVLPYTNALINDDWATDKARLAFDGFKRQRLKKPILFRAIRRGPLKYIRKVNEEAFKFFFEKKLFSLLVSLYMNKFVCKLRFLHKFYISSIIDADAIVSLNLIFTFYSGATFTSIIDALGNVQNKQIAMLRDNYLLANKLKLVIKSDKIYLVGFNPSIEAPLLFFKILKQELDKNPKPLQIITKANNLFVSDLEISFAISLKKIILVDFEHGKKTFYFLLGQSLFNRRDFNSTCKLLKKQGILNTLVPTNVMLPALLEFS